MSKEGRTDSLQRDVTEMHFLIHGIAKEKTDTLDVTDHEHLQETPCSTSLEQRSLNPS